MKTTVLSCLLLLLLTGCKGREKDPPPRPPIAVQTVVAIKTDTPVIIKAFGNTEDHENVDIVAQVSGLLLKTLIQDGDVVTKGQTLFQIDDRDYSARVTQLKGVISADRANLKLAQDTVTRNYPLFEKQLLSEGDYDALTTKVTAAAAQLEVDEANLLLAKLNLERCTINSPLSGVCSRRYIDDGNLVTAGVTRLTNIRSYDPMCISFSVSEQYLPVLRKAMDKGPVSLDILVQGDPRVIKGTLKFLDNTVNMQSETIFLRGEVQNSDLKLWAGQFAYVNIYAGMVKDSVMVPECAVQFGKNGPYLFVVTKENKADMRPVKTGVRHNDLIQVKSGVNAGERVVVLGQLMLGPEAAVFEAGQK